MFDIAFFMFFGIAMTPFAITLGRLLSWLMKLDYRARIPVSWLASLATAAVAAGVALPISFLWAAGIYAPAALATAAALLLKEHGEQVRLMRGQTVEAFA